jgi:hypothetical protein
MLKLLPRCPKDLRADLPCAAMLSRSFAAIGVRRFDYSKRSPMATRHTGYSCERNSSSRTWRILSSVISVMIVLFTVIRSTGRDLTFS